MKHRREPDFVCPICGADVVGGARSCPECGSDDETGWSQETDYDDLDLPDDHADVDYESAERIKKRNPFVVVVVIVMIVVSLFLLFKAQG